MKVKFLPSGDEYEIQPNQSVMELAHQNGVFIKSVCNGVPNCAECRVKIVEGDENVMEPSAKELSLIGTGYFIDHRRLSCQLKCYGDIVVDLSEQLEKQKSAPKKVLGNRKMDLEKSHAVNEMLIDADKELVDQIESNKDRPQQKHTSNRGRGQGKKGRRRRSSSKKNTKGSSS